VSHACAVAVHAASAHPNPAIPPFAWIVVTIVILAILAGAKVTFNAGPIQITMLKPHRRKRRRR
jgi:hypothetical protein